MRLIDADELIKSRFSIFDDDQVVDVEDILRAPTIEAEPVKHGQWIKVGDSSWECSACHEVSCCKGNYCPDCGARMTEGSEEC